MHRRLVKLSFFWTLLVVFHESSTDGWTFSVDRPKRDNIVHQHQQLFYPRHERSYVIQMMTSSPLEQDPSSTTKSSSVMLNAEKPKDHEIVVLEAIDELFPPQGLDQRIALSRKDGYWPYISTGKEPPLEFVYGEFDTEFFAQVLTRAGEHLKNDDDHSNQEFSDWVFCDLGSGTGRLVLTAAGLFPWKLCRGIELLEGINDQAMEKLDACRVSAKPSKITKEDSKSSSTPSPSMMPTPAPLPAFSSSNAPTAYLEQYQQFVAPAVQPQMELLSSPQPEQLNVNHDNDNGKDEFVLYHSALDRSLPLAPMELHCGSFTDPYQFFGDAQIIFVFSSAMPDPVLEDLAQAVCRQCRPGTLILTTEYQLPTSGKISPNDDDPNLPSGEYGIELVETLTGENESTGGLSTVYIQRLVQSYGNGMTYSPPQLSVSEIAYRVIIELEKDQSQTQKDFLRHMSNQMVFMGFPESWLPKLKE